MQPYLPGTAVGIWNSSGCRPSKASRERHPLRRTVRSSTDGNHLMSLNIKVELEGTKLARLDSQLLGHFAGCQLTVAFECTMFIVGDHFPWESRELCEPGFQPKKFRPA